VHAEALAILGTTAADLFFNRWNLEILPDCLVQCIPRSAPVSKATIGRMTVFHLVRPGVIHARLIWQQEWWKRVGILPLQPC
jgi:hypothetical protein